jgi:(1->4)-alpha-D-glucan 1-alpha-D-glucosylmutase
VVVEDGANWVRYFDHRFPTSPDSRSMLGDAARPATRLHRFLEAQHYRLCHWRLAPDAINYRRFFDINDLAVIRVDRREVYDRVHELVFELIGDGMVDGLRLDHIDGLKDPAGYLQRLQADASAAGGAAARSTCWWKRSSAPARSRATGRSPAPPAMSSPTW